MIKKESVGCKPDAESSKSFKLRHTETEKSPLPECKTMTEKSKLENPPSVSDAKQFQTSKLQTIKKQKGVSQSASDGKFQMSLNVIFFGRSSAVFSMGLFPYSGIYDEISLNFLE